MSFMAFIIWLLIVAGTAYMLWKLVFEGRVGKKVEQEPMAVKTEGMAKEAAEKDKPEEFSSDVAKTTEETPPAVEENSEEPEVIEGEAEEIEAEKGGSEKVEHERPEKPEKTK